MRPGVGDVYQGVASEAFLQLPLKGVVVGGVDVAEKKSGAVAGVRANHSELVRVASAVNAWGRCWAASGDVDRVSRSGAGKARSSGRAVQVGVDCGLITLKVARKMDAVTAVVADICQPGLGELALHIKAPLLTVGRFIVNRQTGLDGEWRRGRGNAAAERGGE